MQNQSSPGPSLAARAGKKLKRFFIGLFLIAVLLSAAVMAALTYINYGEGYRVGTVLKLSRKGVVFKTWEGELSQGFLESSPSADSGVATRIWYFTVEARSDVVEQINHAIDANKKVKLYYNEKYAGFPWVGDTRQIVYKVEEVQNSQ
jgi:hypothetical protein